MDTLYNISVKSGPFLNVSFNYCHLCTISTWSCEDNEYEDFHKTCPNFLKGQIASGKKLEDEITEQKYIQLWKLS